MPPSPSEPVWQSMNQRWRERPRCPAPPVTPGHRDGVVHAIVGRAACRCLRAQFVQDERGARVHVFVSRFPGTIRSISGTEIGSRTRSNFRKSVALTNLDLAAPHHRAFHAGAVLGVVSGSRGKLPSPSSHRTGLVGLTSGSSGHRSRRTQSLEPMSAVARSYSSASVNCAGAMTRCISRYRCSSEKSPWSAKYRLSRA